MEELSFPVFPAEASNGEFVPRSPSRREGDMAAETLRLVGDSADRDRGHDHDADRDRPRRYVRKRKIFGLNAAPLFGVDPTATRGALDGDKLSVSRQEFASFVDNGRIDAPWQAHGLLSRRSVLAFMRTGGTIGVA